MTKDCILCLCNEDELTRERRGYFQAFSKKINILCVPFLLKDGQENINNLIPSGFNPILILQPEAYPRLPSGLVETSIPTACFQIDTYSGTEKRIKWSMLFDYVFVFHPGFDQVFKNAGHPKAICLPHAVEANLFQESGLARIYDVGWVGNTQNKNYSVRRRCLEELKKFCQMNDISRQYSAEAMANIYTQSKIVVNISRDDYLQDANLRCFEAMAAGALLITHKQTEMKNIGFIEGVHYVAYSKEKELYQLVQFYLKHEDKRREIASAGRFLVMEKHTYDQRVQTILDVLEQDNGQLFAPARTWNKAHVHATYLHYFAKHLMLDASLKELREIHTISPQMTWQQVPTITKSFIRALQLSL